MPEHSSITAALRAKVGAALGGLPLNSSLCVAFSGGRDSSVLLDAVSGFPEYPLRAVYVNHGLHPDADSWAEHCGFVCERSGIRFCQLKVHVDLAAGQGVEAAARDARYHALWNELEQAEVLLTAHHEQDQLETFLLQLFRGAGISGLAGMPALHKQEGRLHLRPMLGIGLSEVEAYATERGLDWIEDPTNQESRFDRNYLRNEVLPLIQQRWPSAGTVVSRAARLSGTAAEMLDDLALIDLQSLPDRYRLSVASIRSLSMQRQANVLRYLLRSWSLPVPSEAQLHQALKDLLTDRHDALPEVSWGGVHIRRYRDSLWFFPASDPFPDKDSVLPVSLSWNPSEPLDMGALRGRLELIPAEGPVGLAESWLQRPLEVRFRVGGEKLRPAENSATRTLKNLLQESDVVPWMRGHIPLVYSGGQLLAVGDLWIDSACKAAISAPSYRVKWTGHAPIR